MNSGDMNSNSTSSDSANNANAIVYFAFDSSDLTEEAKRVIDQCIENNNVNTIYIEGHCDERGTREYNLALGERRANTVKTYMQTKGVAKNIVTISYGKERPTSMERTESGYAQNRRAEIKNEASK